MSKAVLRSRLFLWADDMISIPVLCRSVALSMRVQREAARRLAEFRAAKEAETHRQNEEWRQEQERRRIAQGDTVALEAAARAREAEREETRLAEMTAMIIRQTRR